MRACLPVSLLIALAACGEGSLLEQEIRNDIRAEEIIACNAVDWSEHGWTREEQEEVCNCATDRWMRDSSLGELITGGNEDHYQEVMDRCARKVSRRVTREAEGPQ